MEDDDDDEFHWGLNFPSEEVLQRSLQRSFHTLDDLEDLIDEGMADEVYGILAEMDPDKPEDQARRSYLLARIEFKRKSSKRKFSYKRAKREMEKALELCPDNQEYQEFYQRIVVPYYNLSRMWRAVKKPLIYLAVAAAVIYGATRLWYMSSPEPKVREAVESKSSFDM